jgi:hypothetical protein
MAMFNRMILLHCAALVLASTAAGTAQAQSVVETGPVEVRQGVPPPGKYRIQSRSAGKCLGWVVNGIRTVFLGLMTAECTNNPNANLRASDRARGTFDNSSVYIVPITRIAFAIVHNHDECLTKARNVIIGPASIDYVRCGSGSEVRQSGLLAVPDDQRFRMGQLPDGGVRIYPVGRYPVRNAPVFTVRDNGTAPGTDIIAWPFKQGNDQIFDLIYMGPLPESLQVEYRAAMAAADARAPDAPDDGTIPVEAIQARYATSAASGVLSSKAALFRSAPSIADSASAINATGLRAASALPPPTDLSAPSAFVLDMGVAPASATLEAPSVRAAWRLAIPYRFAVEGVKVASVSCVLEDANGTPVGERNARIDMNGPSAGTLLIGIPRVEGTTGSVARTECQASLGGERAGTDWEAWAFEAPAMPSGWDVFVKEAGKSRFWTGAPFQPGFSLHIGSR